MTNAELIDDIRTMVKGFANYQALFDTPVTVKGSPHSHALKIDRVEVDRQDRVWIVIQGATVKLLTETMIDFAMIAYSIRQRLKIMVKA